MTADHDGAERPQLPRSLYVALLPGVGWWMVNVGFYTLGVLDTDQRGYRAWLDGLSGFPRWFQSVFARLSPLCWISALVVVGAVALLRGPRVWWRVIAGLVAITAISVLLVLGATAIWPDAPAPG